jgi:hypothetical protein
MSSSRIQLYHNSIRGLHCHLMYQAASAALLLAPLLSQAVVANAEEAAAAVATKVPGKT